MQKISLSKKVQAEGKVDQIIKMTGISKKEVLLLDQLSIVSQKHPEMQKGLLIGGTAFRLYLSKDKKHLISRSNPTDLDFAFPQLPKEIVDKLIKEFIVLRVSHKTIYDEPKIIYDPKYPVWHIDPKLEDTYPELNDICFFQENITMISITEDDFAQSRLLRIKDKNDKNILGEINIADPGLLLATMLNPQAYTPKRIYRSILMIGSMNEIEINQTAMRYASVIIRSGIAQKSLEPILVNLNNKTKIKGSIKHKFREKVKLFIDITRIAIKSAQNLIDPYLAKSNI